MLDNNFSRGRAVVRHLACIFIMLALLVACDRHSTQQKEKQAVADAQSTVSQQKLAENETNADPLIIDNDVEEPAGDAIDKAEHDDEVEVDMD